MPTSTHNMDPMLMINSMLDFIPINEELSLWENVINLYQLSTQVHNAHLIGRVRKNKKPKTQGTLV